ncbi:MAG: hypothetical protein H7Z21_18075, partial [Hymenobacter sp.]|nr:hypothetical protein [Hymenobacter sp.]
MNHSYLRTMRRTLRPYHKLLVLLLLVLPGLAQAQNFTETFGTTAAGIDPFETLAAADTRNALDNSAALSFSGDALGSPNNGLSTGYSYANAAGTSVNASGGASIVFARRNGGAAQSQLAVEYTFIVGNINTTGLNSRQRISFGLRVPVGSADGDLILEARDGNTANPFVAIPFTFPVAPAAGNEWELVTTTASLPSTTNLILRVRKPANISTRQFRLDDLTIRGFASALTATIDSQIFPNTPVNQRSAPQNLTVTGTDLTANAVVTAPTGYLVRISGVGSYAQSVTILPNANGNASAVLDVIFAPTFANAAGPYPQTLTGSLTVSSAGATTRSVTITGQATAPQSILTANPTALAFGSQTVGTSSVAQAFQLTGQDLTSNITVTAPSGFEIRVGGGAFSPNPLTLVPTNGSLSTQIDVRFVPGTTGTIAGNV